MKEKLYSINELVDWYYNNTNCPISDDFIIYMINNKILSPCDISLYSLNDLNDLLLEKYNENYVKDSNNKFKIKENRMEIINKYPFKKLKKIKKFKLTSLKGNKLKLIKLS